MLEKFTKVKERFENISQKKQDLSEAVPEVFIDYYFFIFFFFFNFFVVVVLIVIVILLVLNYYSYSSYYFLLCFSLLILSLQDGSCTLSS